MCRSNADGGRRCGAHSDPARRGQYNSLRRARYTAETRGLQAADVARSGDGKDYPQELLEQWQTLEPLLTEEEKQVLKDYTGQDYERINRSLYDSDYAKNMARNNPELYRETQHQITTLDKVLAKSTPHQSPRPLYRIFKPPVESVTEAQRWVEDNYQEGHIVTFNAFTSTSANPNAMIPMMHQKQEPSTGLYGISAEMIEDEPEDFQTYRYNTVFEMVTGKGAPVGELSHMRQEAEVLLPRGTQFIVTRVYEQVQYSSSENLLSRQPQQETTKPTRVVQLVEVGLVDKKTQKTG